MDFIKPNSRILLVEPPFYRFFGYQRWYYPVTLTLIATYLEEQGHSVRVLDVDQPTDDCRPLSRDEVRKNYHHFEQALKNAEHPIWNEVRTALIDYKPDVVGFTSITPKIESANILAKMCKELFGNNVITMLGGAHVQGMLKSHPDYCFGEEYDHIVPHIPNLVNRRPNRKLIINYEQYSAQNFASLMTSFGCPNTCTFCCHSYEKNMVYRDIGNIRQELEDIQELFQGNTPISTTDDCFFSNIRHFEAVTELFSEFKFPFSVGSRVMALSQAKIETFALRGGERLYVGIESGSQKILDRVEKRLKVEQIIARTQWLNDAGIPWNAFFISGFPFETVDDMKLTVELIERIRPTFVSLNRFTPYPGTALYNEFYRDVPLRFSEVYQLNQSSPVHLGDEMEDYLESMYTHFDSYNQQMKASREAKG